MLPTEVVSSSSRADLPQDFLFEKSWRVPYSPWLRQGDLQTIAARYWPRRLDQTRFPTKSRYFEPETDTRVLAKLNLQAGARPARECPTVVAVHGLTACDRAPYMLSSAQRALERGFDVVRLNVRNCGGTEHLCRTLYHSGLTVDLRYVVEALAPRPLYLLGFSMGGNMALKLAGEWSTRPPAHVRAVCAVSPPIRLDLCSRNMGRPRNALYELRFLRQLRATIRRKSRVMPHVFSEPNLGRVDSIWQFDEVVTAPAFGFRDAADYYERCSAARFLEDIRVPTLLVQARDDPFIPFEAIDLPALRTNRWIRLLDVEHGGHVAFLAKGRPRFWAEAQAMQFFAAMESRRSTA